MKTTRFFTLALALAFYFQGNSQVVINEYSASNFSGFTDNFGENEDWVELYNTSASPVNLSGYYLSDRAGNPTKFMLGAVSVPGNGFLRVWCSGRNINTGTIHTNFKLTQCKPEKIIFASPAGIIIDSLTMVRTQVNHSRGRLPNGANTWSVFTTPTPGASNTGTALEYATTPSFSVQAGFYPGSQTVTITTPDPNITLRYTTNGSAPTGTSTIYSAPISITTTTVLRVTAYSSNPAVLPSFIASNTYFISAPAHNMPVLSVFGTSINNLLSGQQIVTTVGLEYFDKNGVFKTEAVGEADKHGNDSWAYAQRGIDFVARDEFGYNNALKDQIFAGKSRTEYQRIIIKAGANDNYPFENGGAHVRDAYVHTLSQVGRLYVDERTSAFCVLYVNGVYWGVYDYREKVDDSDFADYYFNQDELYKGSKDYLQYLKTWGQTWEEYGKGPPAMWTPPPQNWGVARQEWNNLRNYVMNNNMGVQANFNYVDSIYNLKSLVDYFIVGSYTVASDWLNWNTSWWRGTNPLGNHKKWRYSLWDLDATFGHYINYTNIPNQNQNADPCDPNSLTNPGGQGHVPMLKKLLLENANFKAYYVNRYIDLLNGPLSCTRAIQVLDSMVQVIQPEMQRHTQRWGGSVGGWQNNVNSLRNYISQRCSLLFALFMNCQSDFGPLSGPYTIKLNVDPPNSGTILFNTNLITTFGWQGTYLGGPPQTLKANANTGYVFSHWENFATQNVIQPDTTDTLVTVVLAASDSIVAHFTLTNPPPPPPHPPTPIPPAGVFFIPSAFSPNGDGSNDYFQVFGGDVREFHLVIYNRWGEKIFETKDQSKGWDGNFKGQPMNTGVYAYQIQVTFGNGEKLVKSGNLALVR
jgi:gliding motility-associated-like protein